MIFCYFGPTPAVRWFMANKVLSLFVRYWVIACLDAVRLRALPVRNIRFPILLHTGSIAWTNRTRRVASTVIVVIIIITVMATIH